MPTAPPDWSCSLVVRIDAALEAIRGVGLNAEAARGAADERRLEPGALEEDVLRRRGDLALRAADDAAEAHRVRGVGDDDGGFVELADFVVEAAQGLAGLSAADD